MARIAYRFLRISGRASAGTVGLLMLLTAMTAGADPEHTLYIGVNSRSFVTMVAEPRVEWRTGLLGSSTDLAVRAELPALLNVKGGFDTFSLSVAASQALPLGRGHGVTRPRVGPRVGWTPLARCTVELGLDRQNQALGAFTSISGSAGLAIGVENDRSRLAATARWDQTIATHWVPGQTVIDTFTGTEDGPPSTGWFAGDHGRLLCGAALERAITGNVWACTELLGVLVRHSFVHGFEGMLFGEWPFRVTLGARVALPPTSEK